MIAGYRKSLAVVAVALFFTNVSNYTQQFGVIPLAWIGLFAGLCVPVAVHGLFTGRVPIRPLAWWGSGYLLVSVLWFYRSPQDAFAYEEVQLRVLSVIFLVLSLIVFSDASAQRVGRVAIAAATMLAVGFNLYELFNPQTFSDIVGRAAGLYGNSNQSAAALVLGLILGYAVVPGWLRGTFVAATAIGIIPTFSRSGILAWLLVVAFFTLRAGFGVAQMRRVVVLAALVVGLLVSPVWGDIERELYERGTLNLNVLDRLAFFGGGEASDASTSERKAVATKAWSMVGEEPFRGHGTGASVRIDGFEVGTHNVYLAMMVDHGFLAGIAVIPLLLLATMWGATRRTLALTIPFAAFIAMWSLFSHNVLEERYILLSIGLTASVVAVAARSAAAEAGSWERECPSEPSAARSEDGTTLIAGDGRRPPHPRPLSPRRGEIDGRRPLSPRVGETDAGTLAPGRT